MNSQHFQSLLCNLDNLSFTQLKRLRHSVEEEMSSNQVGQVVAEKEEDTCYCPNCDSVDISRWGRTKQGIQRYRCKSCLKTFNALAGTGVYRMRMPDKWIQYTQLMWDGVSLRKSAALLNINLRTAFRWRHAFLKLPTSSTATEIAGIIEADETFVRESFKGQKKLPRKSRKRGGGHSRNVPVAIALNRTGDISEKILPRNTKKEIQAFLKPLLTEGSVLCTDGNASYKGLNIDLDIDHKRLVGLDNQRVIDGIYHIQTLNNYMMSWKNWMWRFRGVATKYLANYLGWYRFMAQQEQYDQTWVRNSV